MKSIILIPCYNVEKYCSKVIEQAISKVDQLVLINDGSTDSTLEILQRYERSNSEKISLISFPFNQGKGFALIEAFKYALSHVDFDVLITMDSDGQHNASDIPLIKEKLEKGADMVIGERTFSLMPMPNRWANRITSFLLRCIFPNAPLDTQSGYRGLKKDFIREIVSYIKGHRYETEFLILLLALAKKKSLDSISIATVYFNGNRSSHFLKIRDSLKILKVLALFIITRKFS